VRLQLHALAYNLGNLLRTLATPEPIKDWSLTSPEGKSDQDQSSTRGGTRRSLHLARNYQLAQHKREDTGGER